MKREVRGAWWWSTLTDLRRKMRAASLQGQHEVVLRGQGRDTAAGASGTRRMASCRGDLGAAEA
eukprot:342426-Heterocapsa_arctica.AAC.1